MVDKVFSFGGGGGNVVVSPKTVTKQVTSLNRKPLKNGHHYGWSLREKNVTWLGLAKGQGFRLKCEV